MRTPNLIVIVLPFLVLLFSLTACKPEWTTEEKSVEFNSCMKTENAAHNRNAKAYCECFMEKLMEKFPEHDFEEAELDSLHQYSMDCREATTGAKVVWPENAQEVFMNNCIKLAREQGKKNSEKYCSCVLQSVMVQYPNAEDLAVMNQDSMQHIGIACDSSLK
jgi:hypothetical protein